MNKVYDAFLPCRDKHGLVQNNIQGRTTQNGSLWSVEYIFCLIQNRAPEAAQEILRLEKVFAQLEVIPGVTGRDPISSEYDSMDNTSAMLVFSALFCNRDYAKRMKQHGLSVVCDGYDSVQDPDRNTKYYPLASVLGLGKPKNYWNCANPSKYCFAGWYGRSPGFMGLVDIAADGSTTTFRALSIAVGQMLSVYGNNNSDMKLAYIVWQLLKTRGLAWKLLYKWWTKRLYKKYPDGMKGLYREYFNDSTYPLAEYTK